MVWDGFEQGASGWLAGFVWCGAGWGVEQGANGWLGWVGWSKAVASSPTHPPTTCHALLPPAASMAQEAWAEHRAQQMAEGKGPASGLPQIVYSSRTHSQLQQVMRELRSCSYRWAGAYRIGVGYLSSDCWGFSPLVVHPPGSYMLELECHVSPVFVLLACWMRSSCAHMPPSYLSTHPHPTPHLCTRAGRAWPPWPPASTAACTPPSARCSRGPIRPAARWWPSAPASGALPVVSYCL